MSLRSTTAAMWAVAWIVVASTGLAQPGPGPGPGAGPPRGGPGPGPGPMLDRFVERMDRALDLSDEQLAEVERLAEETRARLDPATMQELAQEMREARRSGDAAREEEVRARMDALRESHQKLMEEFAAQVEPLLTEEQRVQFTQMRERMQMERRDRESRGDMRRLIHELPEALSLTDEQRTQYDELLATMRKTGAARRESIQSLMEQLRAAEEAGDTAKADELRAQLAAVREPDGAPVEQFFTDLEKILTEAQKATLAELQSGAREGAAARGTDVQDILRAARRLDLDSATRDKVQEIMQRSMRERRALRRADTTAQSELATKTRQEIEALLTAEQKQQFEELLKGQPARERGGRERRARHGAEEPAAPDNP